MAIPMIWNNVIRHTSCNEYTWAILMLPISPVTISFWSVCSMDYGPHPIESECKSCQRCLSLPCVTTPTIWNTSACNTSWNKLTVTITTLTLPLITMPILIGGISGGWVAWIMIPSPLCMHVSYVMGVFPCPPCPQQWSETPLHGIRHVMNSPGPFTCLRYPPITLPILVRG